VLTRFLAGFGQRFRKHPVRGLLLILAVVGLIHAARMLSASSREVILLYEGLPPGGFEVEVRDAEGQSVRRASFGASAERSHPMTLADGRYEVRLRMADGRAARHAIVVSDEGGIIVRWRPTHGAP
jgi:hypothetical protein